MTSNTFQNSPPKRIWLQWWGDIDPDKDSQPFDTGDGITWCKDKIFNTDIEYILKDKIMTDEDSLNSKLIELAKTHEVTMYWEKTNKRIQWVIDMYPLNTKDIFDTILVSDDTPEMVVDKAMSVRRERGYK